MRVATRDRKTGRTGSALDWIEVPSFKEPRFALSRIFLPERAGKDRKLKTTRALGASLFALLFLLVALFTTLARVEDRRDPRVREQLSKQARQEEEFRLAPFQPDRGCRNQVFEIAGAFPSHK